MSKKNAFYAQSGGVTAVINATAQAVINTARKHRKEIGTVYAGKNGILGALKEELIDTKAFSTKEIKALSYTPGGAFGSCRYKLKPYETEPRDYERIMEVFKAHNIGYFFYNGGGDSQDTAYKLSEISKKLGFPLTCIGIPKTIDNDLAFTDNCPGFGSVAKYVAVSIREAAFDVRSMASTSTKVFILEVMGRHAGWIAASSGLASKEAKDAPHIILLPEVPFDRERFLQKVSDTVKKYDYCTIVASEGIRNPDGTFLSEAGTTDAFGHKQLGGVAPILASLIKSELKLKYHWALSDYLQRSARHIASKVDLAQAYKLGEASVQLAIKGHNAVMPIIVRISQKPYRWKIEHVPLNKVANVEKKLPKNFISKDGFHITSLCKAYLEPLIQGEAYPPYREGLPAYASLSLKCIKQKLANYKP